MRIPPIFFSLPLSLFAIYGTSAENTANETPPSGIIEGDKREMLSPKNILAKAIEAHGGKGSIMKQRKGILKAHDNAGKAGKVTVEGIFDWPRQWKRTLTMNGEQLVTLSVAGKVWEWEDGGKVREAKDPDTIVDPNLGLLRKLVEANESRVPLLALESQKVDNELAPALRIQWKKNFTDCYFSTTSGLLVRWDIIWQPQPTEKYLQKTFLTEYKEIDGVKMAYRQRVFLKGDDNVETIVADFAITEVKLVKTLAEDTFALPKDQK